MMTTDNAIVLAVEGLKVHFRSETEVREMSIRLALGASRSQLIRQWLTECMLLAAAG